MMLYKLSKGPCIIDKMLYPKYIQNCMCRFPCLGSCLRERKISKMKQKSNFRKEMCKPCILNYYSMFH